MKPMARYWLIFIAISAVIVAGTGLGLWRYIVANQEALVHDLLSVATLKQRQIVNWREERLDDAAVLSESPLLKEDVERWMANPDETLTRQLKSCMDSIRRNYRYEDVLLLNPAGEVRLRSSETSEPIAAEEQGIVAQAITRRVPVLGDLRQSARGNAGQELCVAAPMFAEAAPSLPIGVFLLRVDVNEFLYPMIQEWPSPSKSAETLLVRRDGDSALMLNELRHKKNTALKFRIPLSQTEVPAVQAVLGSVGIVTGVDYRGVRVFAAVEPVPGTGWYIVAKEDMFETFGGVFMNAAVACAFMLVAVALLVAVGAVFYERHEKKIYRQAFKAEAEARKSEQRYHVVLDSVCDGVITTDLQGVVELMNPAAELLTGWSQAEALGKPLETIFCILNEATRQLRQDPVAVVIREDHPVSILNHTLLISRDSVERSISMAAAPIRSDDEILNGVVLTFRDRSEKRAIEKALREREEEYRHITDCIRDAIVTMDADTGRILFTAGAMESILGYTAEELVGKPFAELIPERFRMLYDSGVAEHKSNLCSGVDSRLRDTFGLHKSGKEIPIEMSLGDYYQGGRRYLIGVMRDITQRKNDKEQFQMLFENSLSGIAFCEIILDGQGKPVDYMHLSVNPAYEMHTGMRADSVVGRRVSELLPGADMGPVIERYGKVALTGQSDHFEQHVPALQRDFEIGVCKIVDMRIAVIFRDITDAKQAEERQRLQSAALNAAANAIVITDLNGTIEWVNTAFTTVTGYTSEEAIGKNPRVLVKSTAHTPEFYENLWKTILAGKVWSGEFTNRRKDGNLYNEKQTITPLRDASGAITHFIGIKQDITANKQLEAQYQHAQKLESVGRLAGGVAHDFNNLLTVIRGYAELASTRVEPDTQASSNIKEVLIASDRAAELIGQLLAFARRQTIEPQILDLNRAIEGLPKMLECLIGEDVELHWRPGANLWRVMADRTQIDQVIINLVVNARDAISDVGSVTIATENVELDAIFCDGYGDVEPGQFVHVSVADTGCGMSPETLMNIFEPFFTTKNLGKGTGLGLATVYGIVRQNGGFIRVESECGKGTTFHIYIPRHTIEPPDNHSGCAPLAPPTGTETVLLVEDSQSLLRLARITVEQLGYKALSAGGAREALELADSYNGTIHMLLTDVIMPGMNGHELALRLKESRPEIKVLYMSGYSSDIISEHGILNDEFCLLRKPFTTRSMAIKLRETLDVEANTQSSILMNSPDSELKSLAGKSLG